MIVIFVLNNNKVKNIIINIIKDLYDIFYLKITL